MKQKLCTITGIDTFTNLNSIKELSEKFPFVEWGILYSPSRANKNNRYMTLSQIVTILKLSPSHIRFAIHFCGSSIEKFLNSDDTLNELLTLTSKRKARIQLNFNSERLKFTVQQVAEKFNAFPEITFITQENVNNNEFNLKLIEQKLQNHCILFDNSGGKGITPETWPKIINNVWCGFAGGIGPENIYDTLSIIQNNNSENFVYWIDMESKVRNDENWLDFNLVEKCLNTYKIHLINHN